MHPATAEIWRFVRDCGEAGTTSSVLHTKFDVVGERTATTKRINNLVLMGFLKGAGPNCNRQYTITAKCPVGQMLQPHAPALPKPEAAPSPAKSHKAARKPPGDAADDDSTEELFAPRVPVSGVPPGVPNSVFALGDMAAGLPPAHNGVPPPLSAAALAMQPAPAPAPRFALQSTGELVIQYPGPEALPIELPPDVTRALFRFLDLLGGTSLNRLAQGEHA